MSEECSAADLFSLLGNDCARLILKRTSVEPMSAKELGEAADVSLPTVYRHLDRLEECGLVVERTAFEDGTRHYSVYETTLERLLIVLSDGEFEFELETEEADHDGDPFVRMWDGVQQRSSESDDP